MPNTKIEWCDKTWSPITGCSPISEGCTHCYAKRMSYRLKGRYGYPKDEPFKVTFHPDRLNEPLHWKKPSRIFVVSMGDLFHEEVRGFWIESVMNTIHHAYWHTFLFLTKRPKRMEKILSNWDLNNFKNLWLGVSVENQRTADERIPILCHIPGRIKFVSVEPILGDIHFYKGWFGLNGINWVICGCESGPKRRKIEIDWIRNLRDQCSSAGIPFFLKQMEVNGKLLKMPELDRDIISDPQAIFVSIETGEK